MSERKVSEKVRKPRASAGAGAGASSRKKKSKADESDEERDAEGVRASGGVGSLVLERKSGGSKKKKSTPSKRKKGADDSEAESEAEDGAGGQKKKPKKGASSVDTSKAKLSRAEQLHEEYMELKVDDLKKILGVNNMANPAKPINKDRLAWQCVFGEILGAPAQLCTRCGKGKLKPKIKGEFALADVKKGVTKWTCPGYFDDEADSIAFCNKAYTDAEIKTVPFKGKGHVTAEDEAALAARKEKLAEERKMAQERRAEMGLDDEESRASSPSGTPKKKFIHAPRVDEKTAAAAAAGVGTIGSAVGSEAEDEGEDVPAGADVGMGVMELADDPAFASFVSDPVAARVTASHASSDQRAGHGAGGAHADRPLCRYEPKCFRLNPDHLAEFAHPARDKKEAEAEAATAAANAKEKAEAKQAEAEE